VAGFSAVAAERAMARWTMVRVNDPRRDPASVKSDVRPFCAAPDSEAGPGSYTDYGTLPG